MPPNYIALAIPFFFVCIAVELLAARRLARPVYRFADAVTDLGCGVWSELAKLFLHAAVFAGYLWVYRRVGHDHGPFPLLGRAGALWPWLAAFVLVDLLYYWWHRLSHEVNLLWAAHVVHHTSEDYNLAVALRQAIATHFTAVPFYLPLAALGVPPTVYLTAHSFNTLYQFWIHTELVGTLGPLEWVLNTPSHHRVHHAINPRYLDRNYAGILIVWDRLFGTFVAEDAAEPPVYGTVKRLGSFNPLLAQFHYWGELARTAWATGRPIDKLRVWLASPAWHPPDLPGSPPRPVHRSSYRKYDPPADRATQIYVGAWFAAAVGLATALIFFEGRWSRARLLVGASLVVATLIAAGSLLERRRWARPFEALRLLAVASAAVAAGLGALPAE